MATNLSPAAIPAATSTPASLTIPTDPHHRGTGLRRQARHRYATTSTNRWHAVTLELDDYVDVPAAVAVSADSAADPPREWAERLYKVTRVASDAARWTLRSPGEPEPLARDIAAFSAAP